MNIKISTVVITVSDSSAEGIREDRSGPIIEDILKDNDDFEIIDFLILPDEIKIIKKELIRCSDRLKVNLILTTGGTGLSDRDITPDVTLGVIDKEVPGISEFIRQISLKKTNRAILSRGVAGIRKKTLIINLPGSPKAVFEIFPEIIEPVVHGIRIMLGFKDGD